MRASGLEPPVSEADLHGFVDGGLDRGRREAVEAFLAASPADAERVGTWQRQNERIRAAFASMETAPLPWASPLAPGAQGEAATARAAGGSRQGGVRGQSHAWRERWFARLIGIAFTSGVLLAAGADYFAARVEAPDGVPLSSSGPAGARASEAFAAQVISALRAFDPPPKTAGLLAREQAREPNLAAPVLPNLALDGLKLAGVRAIAEGQGQMLCLFYARRDAGTLALCVEKTPGPSETAARVSGTFPSAAISWRQQGADYTLAGALPEPELRVLEDAVRAQVEVFDGK
jgi:anti-sigma factor RsiW